MTPVAVKLILQKDWVQANGLWEPISEAVWLRCGKRPHCPDNLQFSLAATPAEARTVQVLATYTFSEWEWAR